MIDLSRLLRARRAPGSGGVLKGVLAGGVMLLVAIGLQVWNEARTYRRDALLSDAAATALTLRTPVSAPANDGRLVHVSGEARASTPVTDPTFGIEIDGLALRRRVEMYQWRERRTETESNGRKNVSYNYDREWTNDTIDSDRFNARQGHDNPGRIPFDEAAVTADDVRVGDLRLGADVLGEIGGWKTLDASTLVLPPNMAVSFRPHAGWLNTGDTPDTPAVGDVRVRFDVMPPGAVSILARQQDGVLVPYRSEDGEELLLAARGEASASELLATAANSNTRVAWAVRVGGFMLAWVGFGLLFRPLTLLADVVPVFGRIAGVGAAIVSGLLAMGLSAMAIGGGWLWQRPWLLAALVVLGMIAAAFAVRRRSPTPASAGAPGVPPPPPPPAA
jgi:hypothetical protein